MADSIRMGAWFLGFGLFGVGIVWVWDNLELYCLLQEEGNYESLFCGLRRRCELWFASWRGDGLLLAKILTPPDAVLNCRVAA
jgi:hypothetical protein